jgi:hypothetical protein
MISIALVLLLILGISKVFTYTTQAVGAGEAINADIRASRAVQTTFNSDLGSIVGSGSGPNDSAFMLINSMAVYAFRNAKDLAAQGTTSPNAPTSGFPTNNVAFLDLNGDGNFGDTNVPGEVVYPSTYNIRNHRLDCLSFFARDTFHRQTGNPGTFVDNMSSTEAWIWYGHLWLPDNSQTGYQYGIGYPVGSFPAGGSYTAVTTGALTLPGAGTSATNPNNFFASQFVLGREAMLLTEQTPVTSTSGVILDQSGNAQWFINRKGAATNGDLSPLQYNSALSFTGGPSFTTSDPGTSGNYTYKSLYNSRVDLASTSISNYRAKLQSLLTTTPTAVWWTPLMYGGLSNTASRFQCNPFVAKPMQAVDMAHASPYFISGCSQFIVEFAGDFLTQDNDPSHVDNTGKPYNGVSPNFHTKYGDITAQASDGQIDFTIVNVGTTASPIYVKQIKWYGMPRGTSGQSTISYSNGDVVPIRDWLLQAVNPTTLASSPITQASFERVIPPKTEMANYAGSSGLSMNDAQNGYLCAFGPNDARPKLIRITMTLEDPSGQLPDGQTYQYVFPVP